jgi:hypothetical protein
MTHYSKLDEIPQPIAAALNITHDEPTSDENMEGAKEKERIMWIQPPPSFSYIIQNEPTLIAILFSPTLLIITFIYLAVAAFNFKHMVIVGCAAAIWCLIVIYVYVAKRHLFLGYQVITTHRAAIVVPSKHLYFFQPYEVSFMFEVALKTLCENTNTNEGALLDTEPHLIKIVFNRLSSSSTLDAMLNSGKITFISHIEHSEPLVFHEVQGIQLVADVLATTLSRLSLLLDPKFELKYTSMSINNTPPMGDNNVPPTSEPPLRDTVGFRRTIRQFSLTLLACMNVLFMLAIVCLILFVYDGQDMIIFVIIIAGGILSVIERIVFLLRQITLEKMAEDEGRTLTMAFLQG